MNIEPKIDNIRILNERKIPSPEQIMDEFPNDCANHIFTSRQAIQEILTGESDRALVVVGPCSIHDEDVAIEYARRLVELAPKLADDLLLVMRVYFEKPRTTIGWKGLINDPYIDNSYKIDEGLCKARSLLRNINRLGLPCGSELLDVFTPQYFADLLSWGAVGARTTESQNHREMASGVSCPIGFKNGTDGSVLIAVNALLSASQPHHFLCISKKGQCSTAETKGNQDTHIILRGGVTGPNYSSEDIERSSNELKKVNLPERLMVDVSHANSGKDYRQQPAVCADISEQLESGEKRIMGLMIESNINEGAQKAVPHDQLAYGVSITDSCINWETTVEVLTNLAAAVSKRRQVNK